LKNDYTKLNGQCLAMRKVLFVCTANIQRSPTAESLFQGWKGIWEAKSAGIMPEPKGNPLTQELIDWADLIIVMEPIHSQYIHAHFKCRPDKIRILNIADRYLRDDPKLISLLRKKAPPFLDEY
jgi:predicted protein tyrosine phosphatase